MKATVPRPSLSMGPIPRSAKSTPMRRIMIHNQKGQEDLDQRDQGAHDQEGQEDLDQRDHGAHDQEGQD